LFALSGWRTVFTLLGIVGLGLKDPAAYCTSLCGIVAEHLGLEQKPRFIFQHPAEELAADGIGTTLRTVLCFRKRFVNCIFCFIDAILPMF